jgi:Sensors of blue-light using FAD
MSDMLSDPSLEPHLPIDSPLVRCIYVSAATRPFDRAALRALLDSSRRNNARLDVTGMLLHIDGSFFQILEGTEIAVTGLFTKIGADKRHGRIVKLIQEPIEERSFGDWSMGLADVTAADLRTVPGLNDFFTVHSCVSNLDSSRAKTLLATFKEGRWRRTIV